MNEIEQKVVEYLERAKYVYDEVIIASDLPIRDRNMLVQIAKMIQIEESKPKGGYSIGCQCGSCSSGHGTGG